MLFRSRKYFDLPADIPVSTYDGRAFLQAADQTYDVIMVDAYQDITIPFQMSSEEFFTMVKNHLADDGVLVVNMNMRGSKEGSITQYLADTIAGVFQTVYTVDVPGSTNRELFASASLEIRDAMYDNMALTSDYGLADLMEQVAEGLVPYQSGGRRMTDDQAPVELLGMRVIDELIGDEVRYYRDIYDRGGIRGLLNEIR